MANADVELIRKALAGQREAVSAFLERMRCVPRIVSAINRKLGQPLGPEERDDVAQEALLAVWKKLAQYDGRAKLETWVYPFCYYEALRRLRKKNRDPLVLQETIEGTGIEPSYEPIPGRDEDELVLKELEALDPDEAIVIRLKLFEDLTFDSIGGRIGISSNTAKSRYYRGVRKLSRVLGKTTRRETTGGSS
jgi:RNA polymerase sigma-70 factor (ECF subfamily)